MRPLPTALVVLCALALGACKRDPAGEAAEEREEERVRREQVERAFREEPKGPLGPEDREGLYALGALLGKRVAPYALGPAELERVERGFADAARARKLELADPDLEMWGPKVEEMLKRRALPALAAEQDAAREKGRKLAAAEAALPGAERLPSGVVVRTLSPGSGPRPGPADRIRVSYVGSVAGGVTFDERTSAELPLGQVIRCWSEGAQRLAVGARARLVCPPSTAYGEEGRPPQIPGGATLVFELQLLGSVH
jgi:FKBP-type peptidyl-prolyl cis-trans isomerase FkpA